MNALELAGRLQMASLPEAEYNFTHADVGTLPVAYPEVTLGLTFVLAAGVEERQLGPWTVVQCSTKPVDVRDALKLLSRLYEDRSAQGVQEVHLPPHGEVPEKRGTAVDQGLTLLHDAEQEFMPPVDQSSGLSASLISAAPPSEDLDHVLVHYLGTLWLQALKGAHGPTGPWLRRHGDQDPLVQAMDRARRLLHPPV
ncbi:MULTISPECIES: hypothetical protein [unclassified Deinococcus]|uniref:hypothetical protein n=1 Tax=unclassified Deinococcus TaxID=2623546 RepID=UPI00117D83FA|nr:MULTISPECIES: hypothetical protein [unclassified Deinococcus]MCD0160158.1 hypothetical protein [Deinococcus sp. 6YEL10]